MTVECHRTDYEAMSDLDLIKAASVAFRIARRSFGRDAIYDYDLYSLICDVARRRGLGAALDEAVKALAKEPR